MERLGLLLPEIISENRKSLNSWFYNASDNDLKLAISLLNSENVIKSYPRQYIKEYIKFARTLLQGLLPEPPSNIDLSTSPNINCYRFAQGCYEISKTIEKIIRIKFQKFFRTCNLIIIKEPNMFKDSRGLVFKELSKNLKKIARPVTSLCRVLNSRVFVLLKIGFDFVKYKEENKENRNSFKTKVQKKKIMQKCVNEMIKKGRVNLEQRAFWRWLVVISEDYHEKIELNACVKEDFFLLKLLAHSANLRYFHGVKQKFDLWKLRTTPEKRGSGLKKTPRAIKANFKQKLKRKLVGLSNLIYSKLDTCYQLIKEHSEISNNSRCIQSKFSLLKPSLRNLNHLLLKSILIRFNTWKNPEYQYEYEEYEEIITTKVSTSKETKAFKVAIKPVVIFEFHESFYLENKPLIRNLSHILKRKLSVYLKRWVKYKKSIDLNFSAEETLDLSMFKLPFARSEKLRMIISRIFIISDIKKNLPKAALSTWMQNSNKRLLTVTKLKLILENQKSNKNCLRNAFNLFESATKSYTNFTDIA